MSSPSAGPDPTSDRAAWYRSLVDSMTQGMFIQAADGHLVAINDATLRIFGLDRETLANLTSMSPVWDVIREDGTPLPGPEHPSMRALLTGRPVVGEVVGLRNVATGERKWLEISAHPECDPGETSPARVYVTMHDLTERRKAEVYYRGLVEASMDAHWVLDADGRIIEASDSACRLTGYSRAELLRMHIRDINAVESPEWVQRHQEHIRTLGSERFETRHRRKDGAILDVEVSARYVADSKVTLIFLRDISARKRQERVDRARMTLLERASSSSLHEVLVTTLDEAERLTDSSIGFYHFLLEDQDTLSLQAWSTRTARDYCKAEGAGLHYNLGDAGIWADCARQRRPIIVNDYANASGRRGLPAGHAAVARMLAVPVIREPRIVAILGVGNRVRPYDEQDARDITRLADLAWDVAERKRAEEEKARLGRQMQQAQRLESLGVLAGGIAHDFNNLLTGILGHADLLFRTLPRDSDLRESASEIVLASGRAAELCQQMLAYAGRGSMRRGTHDLREIVEETAGVLRASLPRRARLDLVPSPEPLPLECDPVQLRQVVTALVTNAAEALEGRTGSITLALRETTFDEESAAAHDGPLAAGPGRYVELEVSDTGCGIAPEAVERIFDPFYSTKFTGRGLGLAAVRGIVQAHHGALAVRSTPGAGATFRVLLPRAAALAARAPDRPAAGGGASGMALFVDDEEAVREVGRLMLQRFGLEVLTAADGAEAVRLFEQHRDRIRIVLLDLTMPGVGGEGTLAALRERSADVPVVLVSGYSVADVRERIASLPVLGLLQKPFTMEELGRMVSAAIGPVR